MDLEGLVISPVPGGSRLRLRVRPSARRSAVEGVHGQVLKVSVSAAPEKGRANEAVERLLAGALELPRSAVTVVAGHASRDKTVEIDELAPSEVRRRIRLW